MSKVEQSEWTPTAGVLDRVQLDISTHVGARVRVLLLCGADLLRSFLQPGVWAPDDIVKILDNHGVAVLSRPGTDVQAVIDGSGTLSKYAQNIHCFSDAVESNVSSTVVRQLVCERQSIRYLVPDAVDEYIRDNALRKFWAAPE